VRQPSCPRPVAQTVDTDHESELDVPGSVQSRQLREDPGQQPEGTLAGADHREAAVRREIDDHGKV
jgi:hypothetical protein